MAPDLVGRDEEEEEEEEEEEGESTGSIWELRNRVSTEDAVSVTD